jgi:sulfoxide reductase heme-binding subunit YedZ
VGLGTIALDLMIAVFVSSLLRAHMRPGVWRGIHWLAYASWPIALAHTFGLGTDSREHWVIVLGGLCVLSVGVALLWRLRTSAKRPTFANEAPPAVPLTRRVTTSSTRRSRDDA